jgi:hypothetical protein
MGSNLLIKTPRSDGKTDAETYNKDCEDFECLEDGTLTRECKYCNLSLVCKQIGFENGKPISMKSDYLPLRDAKTNEVVEWEYFCTGMYDYRPLIERVEDDKAS